MACGVQVRAAAVTTRDDAGSHDTLRHADDPVGGLARAASTSGDSDSIACLTGAFLGARYGMSAWPADWQHRIEYADQLATLATAWD